MELFTNYREWKKEAGEYATKYEKLFSKYEIDPYTMENRVVVIEKKEIFEKLGRKCYPKKATVTEYSVLPLGNYLNTVTGVLFFHDRVERSYTKYGYIPYTMTCHKPDNTKKIRRTFKYVDLSEMVKSAGYREKAVVDNLDRINYDCEDENMEFLTAQDADGHRDGFVYNVKYKKIVG